LQACSTQHHPLVHEDIIADFRGLTYDHSRTVVDKKAPAYSSPGVYLDLREKTVDLRDKACQEIAVVAVKEIGRTVPPQGMKPWVQEKYLPGAPGRRVTFHRGLDVFAHQSKAHDFTL
jgi:hypothetical protein